MSMIGESVTANDMMIEAPDTVGFYLRRGIKHIDNSLGEGYAEEHPELLAGFIQACATELHTGIEAKEIEMVSNAITAVAEQLNELVRVVGIVGQAND